MYVLDVWNEGGNAPTATFYGTVKVGGENVPIGTSIEARMSAEDILPCFKQGAPVTFWIGDQPANETGIWRAGPNELNLTAPAATSTRHGMSSIQVPDPIEVSGFLAGHQEELERPTTYSQPLIVGWNLVVFQGPATPTEQALASILNKVRSVYHFDNAIKKWHRFFPNVPAYVNNLVEMLSFNAYWIEVTQSVGWTY